MNKMATEPMTATAAAEAPKRKRKVKIPANKGMLRTFLMLIVPALLIVGGGYYWLTSGKSVGTDDAQIKQDIVSVSPQVNGQVVEVLVRNGMHVKRGDVLFQIDPQPFDCGGYRRRHHGRDGEPEDQGKCARAAAGAAEAGLHDARRL